MDTRHWKYLICAVLGLIAPEAAERRGVCTAADEPPGPATSRQSSLEQAILITIHTGRPTLLAITSTAYPESRAVWQSLIQMPRVRELMGSVQFVEVVAEQDLARVRLLGVTRVPTFRLYRRGKDGQLELAGQQEASRDTSSVLGWMISLGLGTSPASSPAADPGLMQANYQPFGSPQASPQMPAQGAPPSPPPQPPQPQQGIPPPQPQPLQGVPVVNPPQQMAMAVSTPSTPVYVQPSVPTVILGPTPAPNVIISQSPPSLPTISMAVPAANQPQMMLGMPPQNPQPTPMAAAPPQPTMMAAMPQPTPMAAAPPQPQQSFLSTAAIGLLLNNPGLIDRILGALGRFLAARGNPRIQMNPAIPASFAPTLVPTAQAGLLVNQAQIAGAIPAVPAIPQQLYAAPAPTPGPLPSPQDQGAITPSPQSGPSPSYQTPRPRRFHLFHWD